MDSPIWVGNIIMSRGDLLLLTAYGVTGLALAAAALWIGARIAARLFRRLFLRA